MSKSIFAISTTALLVTTSSCAGLLDARRVVADCALVDASNSLRTPVKSVDVTSLKLYRNTLAVTRVGPYQHHFTIWFHDNEPSFMQVGARIDPATSKLVLAVERGMWGGVPSPPSHVDPPPADVADLQNALEHEAHRRCADSSGWVFRYDGAYREVDLDEAMPVKAETGLALCASCNNGERVGWNGQLTLATDEGMTRVVSQPSYTSGFGSIEIKSSAPVQWVDSLLPTENSQPLLWIDRISKAKTLASGSPEETLVNRVLEAARRMQNGEPSRPLAEIEIAQGESLLPTNIDQHLRVSVSFFARSKPGVAFDHQRQLELPIDLRTSDAATSSAQGAAEGVVGTERFKLRATLTARDALSAASTPGPRRFDGTLTIHIENARGQIFERSYPASGDLMVDGKSIVAPTGLELPGASAPSKEHDALEGKFPANGEFSQVDFYIAPSVSEDPRGR